MFSTLAIILTGILFGGVAIDATVDKIEEKSNAAYVEEVKKEEPQHGKEVQGPKKPVHQNLYGEKPY